MRAACSRITGMSESFYPSPGQLPSKPEESTSAHGSRGPKLGLICVAVGLGIVLAIFFAALMYVGLRIRSAGGWYALGMTGLIIGTAFAGVAAASYRRSEPVRWWQILGAAFGVGFLLNSINRAARTEPISILVGVVNAASLALLLIGGIVAVIQVSAKPAARPSVERLVAPIVGHTADGRPVYGQPVSNTSGLAQQTNVFAVLALVFGIIGGLLGIVFGHIALNQIRRTGEAGRGMAIAGLALGYIYLACILLAVVGYGLFSLNL